MFFTSKANFFVIILHDFNVSVEHLLVEKVVLLANPQKIHGLALRAQACQHKRSLRCKTLGVLHSFVDPQVSSLLQKFLASSAFSHNLTALTRCSPEVCSTDLKALQD